MSQYNFLNRQMCKNIFTIGKVIIKLFIFLVVFGLIIKIGISVFIRNQDNIWLLLILLLFLLLISNFEKLEAFNFFGLSMKLKQKVDEAESTAARMRKLELFTYRRLITQIVNSETESCLALENSYSIFKKSIDDEINSLLHEIGSLNKNDENYVLQPYFLYKISEIALEMHKNFSVILANSSINASPFNPADIDCIRNIVEIIKKDNNSDKNTLNTFIYQLNEWIVKLNPHEAKIKH